jgi:hypothetical protein
MVLGRRQLPVCLTLFRRWKGIQERPRIHILEALVSCPDGYKNMLWHMFEVCLWWEWQCKWRCYGTLEEIPAQSTARLCARTYHWMQMRWDCTIIFGWEEPSTWREDHVMVEIMSPERHNCVPLLCVSSKKLKPLLIGECARPVCFKKYHCCHTSMQVTTRFEL